jgi:hypothetical protein
MPTRGEEIAFAWASHAFLGPFTFLSPYHKNGMELCDVLIIFADYAIVVQQKEVTLSQTELSEVDWQRWKRRAVDSAKTQVLGAIRILNKSGLKLYSDAACENRIHPSRLKFNPEKVFGVIIANGSQYAPQAFSPTNEPTLQLYYGIDGSNHSPEQPFLVNCYLEGQKPLLVLDDYSGHILFTELNTAADFINYVEKRSAFLSRFDFFSWNGEQELIAAYYMSMDSDGVHGFSYLENNGLIDVEMGVYDSADYLRIKASSRYHQKKKLEERSFLVDSILTLKHSQYGDRLLGDNEVSRGMKLLALTSRFERRMISERISTAFNLVPRNQNSSQLLNRGASAGWIGDGNEASKLFVAIAVFIETDVPKSIDLYLDFLTLSAESYALETRRISDLGPTNFAYLALAETCQRNTRTYDVVIDLGPSEFFKVHSLTEQDKEMALKVGKKIVIGNAHFEEFPQKFRQKGR